ncbi:MAG: class I SAM-dependent methyltransferase [bacterium]|nr:class I SAM-dependent methyltransferase [bacterium]
MNDRTVQALLALNRRFYARHAARFSATREHPWTGWNRLLTRAAPDPLTPLTVLDVGCGNGRFASYLALRRAAPVDYLGLDSSPELLRFARQRLGEDPPANLRTIRFRQTDVVTEELDPVVEGFRFSLVTLFGVLHHLPGFEVRRRLLGELSRQLAPGGHLALSIWRFDRQETFASKLLAWERYNRTASSPIDVAQLEDGDHLLTWDGDAESPRFCHLPGDQEIERLLASQKLPCRDRFHADGRSEDHNLYLLFGE